MKKSDSREKFAPALLSAMWVVGLATMAAQAFFGAFLTFMYKDFQTSFDFSFAGVNFIDILPFLFLIIGISEFFAKPKSRRALFLTIIIYYFATFLFSLVFAAPPEMIAAFAILEAILWLILLVATGALLGKKWFFAGATVSVFCAIFSIFTASDGDFRGIFIGIITALILAATAFLVIYLREAGVVKFEIYDELKNRERIGAERLSTIINNLNDAILSVNPRGKIRLYNAATLNLLDTNEDLAGREIDTIFNIEDENGEKVKLEDLIRETEKPVEREDLTHIYADGEKINLYLSIAPLRGNFGAENSSAKNENGAIIIARDITKQKSLDDERDEFISVVSHELRTPVAIAEGTLSNLQLLVARKADEKTFAKTLDAAHDQILYLGQMVNDLSTLSRAQRGVFMDAEEINIEEFMNQLFNKYLPEAGMRNLTLKLDVSTQGIVSVARMAIEEIMQNLIVNALKYTKTGGATISAKKIGDEVEFSVRDTGIGISGSDQKHVFQRFWRSEDYRTRESSGTGLGLFVVGQLAEKIGTKIEVKSKLNRGSEFSFRLKIKQN